MNRPEACLFDLDGLLLDTEPLHGQAWSSAAAIFGTKLSPEQLMALRGRRRYDCAKQIIDWIGSSLEINDLLSAHKPIARSLLGNAKAIPGAEDLISWCFENKLPMALVSSSTTESVAFKSAPHAWLKLITTRVLGDDSDLSNGKPAPDPFLLAAKRLKSDPKSCWAFEDSQSGTKSALSAGCQVWVLQNNEHDHNSNNVQKRGNPRFISSLNVVLEELKEVVT